MALKRKWKALLQLYGHPRVLGVSIPKSLVIWASPSHITLAGLEFGLGWPGMPMSLGFWEWGCPYAYHCDSTRKYMLFLSPVSSRFVVVLVLFQFRGPDYLGAWNRLVSMTSNPGITLSRAYSFIGRLFPKILFSIMRLFISAFLQSHTHEYLLRTVVELNTAWGSKLLSKNKPIQWK